mgnify:CR=1 FL=1|jgi:hypothetical protein
MKSLETNFIQLEYSRPFSSRIDAIEFYKNQDAEQLTSYNTIKPILIIAGLILLVGIGVYIHYQNSKEIEKA